jgi:hypothetical protein
MKRGVRLGRQEVKVSTQLRRQWIQTHDEARDVVDGWTELEPWVGVTTEGRELELSQKQETRHGRDTSL